VTDQNVSTEFMADDRRAAAALERTRADLKRARDLSPSLVPILEAEVAARSKALDSAREHTREYERECVELARATALRRAAVTRLETSLEIDAASEIVTEAARAQYLEAARKRRVEAAQSAATSAYGRASKDIAEQVVATKIAAALEVAVRTRSGDIPAETRAEVLAFLPIAFADARETYLERYIADAENPPASFAPCPSVDAYDAAVRSFWARLENEREKALRLAAALGTVGAVQ
jgi:hypothetical protein